MQIPALILKNKNHKILGVVEYCCTQNSIIFKKTLSEFKNDFKGILSKQNYRLNYCRNNLADNFVNLAMF